MHDQATIATYDRYAETYDTEVIEFWQHFPASFTDAFLAALPGKQVLDLGSGSGRDALLLRDRGLAVTCLDASAAMVAMTTRLGFTSYQADFAHIPFTSASFDGVWAYTSLLHIPAADMQRVLRTLHTLIRPDGALALGMIKGDTAGMVERPSMPDAARYFHYYGREEPQKLVEPAGFVFQSEQDYRPHSKTYLNQLYRRRP